MANEKYTAFREQLVTFIDFLKTGTLKHFPFGIEELRVIKLLGQTDDHAEDMETSMIRYDWTEFYFYKGEGKISRS